MCQSVSQGVAQDSEERIRSGVECICESATREHKTVGGSRKTTGNQESKNERINQRAQQTYTPSSSSSSN